MRLYAYRNLLDDWRAELTLTKICLIIIEVGICLVHPMPRAYPYTSPEKIESNPEPTESYSLSYTAVDVGLGLPSEFSLCFSSYQTFEQ